MKNGYITALQEHGRVNTHLSAGVAFLSLLAWLPGHRWWLQERDLKTPRDTSLLVGTQNQTGLQTQTLTQLRWLPRILKGWHQFPPRNPGWAEAQGGGVRGRELSRPPGEGPDTMILGWI